MWEKKREQKNRAKMAIKKRRKENNLKLLELLITHYPMRFYFEVNIEREHTKEW